MVHVNAFLLIMKMTAFALRGGWLSVEHMSSRASSKLGIRGASDWSSWSKITACEWFPYAMSNKDEANYNQQSANHWVKAKEQTSITRNNTRMWPMSFFCMYCVQHPKQGLKVRAYGPEHDADLVVRARLRARIRVSRRLGSPITN